MKLIDDENDSKARDMYEKSSEYHHARCFSMMFRYYSKS
jgi:hypothetical protein